MFFWLSSDGQIISEKIQNVYVINLCAKGGRFNNFKAALMQIISVKRQKKGTPSLCSKGGRFNYFKAELMKNGQMI